MDREEIHTGTIFIRGARQVLTLRGPRLPRRGAELNELNIIYDGALLIRDGILEEVGPTRRVENLAAARGAVAINAAGRLVMPGFVDSHTHLLFPPASEGDLESAAAVVRATSGKRLASRARSYLDAMARHGTTTVEAKTGCGCEERAETKLLRVLRSLDGDPLDVIPTYLLRMPEKTGREEADTGAVEQVLTEFLPKLRQRKLVQFADFLWEPEPAWQSTYARYVATAARLGLSRKMHAARFDAEAFAAIAAGHKFESIDHLEELEPGDAASILGSGAIATLSPTASLHANTRYAPARQLIDAGVPVALASNFNPRDTPTLNMQTVVALASMHMKMTPAEAICAATINGAHAAGCASRVGSLEHGKVADLLILNVPDYRELGRCVGMNLVHLTMKRGEFIYREGDVARVPAKSVQQAWE